MTFHYRDVGVEDMSQYVEYGEKIKHNDLSSNLSRAGAVSFPLGQDSAGTIILVLCLLSRLRDRTEVKLKEAGLLAGSIQFYSRPDQDMMVCSLLIWTEKE